MAILFKQLSNVKNSKQHNAPYVMATSVPGDFKITEKVAEKLGLKDGSTVLLVAGENDQVFIAKGLGEALRDEKGAFQIDDRKRKMYEGATVGSTVSKVASSTLFKGSNTAAWNSVNKGRYGTVDMELGEPVEGGVLIDEKGQETEDNTYTTLFYPLIEKAFREKSEDTAADEVEAATEEESTPVHVTSQTTTQSPATEDDGFESVEV